MTAYDRGYVFDLGKLPSIRGWASGMLTRIDFYVRLTISSVEAPKVTKTSITER